MTVRGPLYDVINRTAPGGTEPVPLGPVHFGPKLLNILRDVTTNMAAQ